MELDQVFKPAPPTQTAIFSDPFEVQKKKRLRFRPGAGRYQDISVLKIVMVNAVFMERSKKSGQTLQKIPPPKEALRSLNGDKPLQPIGIRGLSS